MRVIVNLLHQDSGHANINPFKEKGTVSSNHQRLSAGSSDKEMDSLRRWFSDKLALGLGNEDLSKKPKVCFLFLY